MPALRIGDVEMLPGERRSLALPVAKLYTDTPLTMPVHVVRGHTDGPRLFVCAAIHGDEINGVEIIRRLLLQAALRRLRGDLIVVPVVNVFGFINRSRYLPDRRDLNRCFPGSERGSLAARMAHLFLSEIVQRCTHGVDLHTGAFQRGNLPQIRTNLENPETAHLASTFGAPIVLHADTPDGSLRAVAGEKGVPVLLYEGGEALRFDELTIRTGVRGVLEVMRELEMLPRSKSSRRSSKPLQARASQWLRAPESGILLRSPQLGQHVRAGQVLCHISDPLGEGMEEVRSPVDGLIIGATRSPLVSEGDALFHVARVDEPEHAESRLQNLVQDVPPGDDPLLYEDPRERRQAPVSRLDDGPSRADD